MQIKCGLFVRCLENDSPVVVAAPGPPKLEIDHFLVPHLSVDIPLKTRISQHRVVQQQLAQGRGRSFSLHGVFERNTARGLAAGMWVRTTIADAVAVGPLIHRAIFLEAAARGEGI